MAAVAVGSDLEAWLRVAASGWPGLIAGQIIDLRLRGRDGDRDCDRGSNSEHSWMCQGRNRTANGQTRRLAVHLFANMHKHLPVQPTWWHLPLRPANKLQASRAHRSAHMWSGPRLLSYKTPKRFICMSALPPFGSTSPLLFHYAGDRLLFMRIFLKHIFVLQINFRAFAFISLAR